MPLYQTESDRLWQEAIARRYARANGGLDVRMMPLTCKWDVEFSRAGKLVSLAEVKRRSCARFTYPTYRIDASKVYGMLAQARKRKVPCGVLVGFTDGYFKVRITEPWLKRFARSCVMLRTDRAGETPDPAIEWSNKLWKEFDEPTTDPAEMMREIGRAAFGIHYDEQGRAR